MTWHFILIRFSRCCALGQVLLWCWQQWPTQKVSKKGAKVLSQSCDVTNQLYWKCQRHTKSKSRENPEYSRKTSFAFAKTAWFCFTFFSFLGSERGLRTVPPPPPPVGTLVVGNVLFVSQIVIKCYTKVYWLQTVKDVKTQPGFFLILF